MSPSCWEAKATHGKCANTIHIMMLLGSKGAWLVGTKVFGEGWAGFSWPLRIPVWINWQENSGPRSLEWDGQGLLIWADRCLDLWLIFLWACRNKSIPKNFSPIQGKLHLPLGPPCLGPSVNSCLSRGWVHGGWPQLQDPRRISPTPVVQPSSSWAPTLRTPSP